MPGRLDWWERWERWDRGCDWVPRERELVDGCDEVSSLVGGWGDGVGAGVPEADADADPDRG